MFSKKRYNKLTNKTEQVFCSGNSLYRGNDNGTTKISKQLLTTD